MSNLVTSPRITWDIGTAYDMFMSLDVLHYPDEFGLRAAWAAGVRSRLPAQARETLQQIHHVCDKGPIYWVYNLPGPKDGAVVLQALAEIPPEARLRSLTLNPGMSSEFREVFERINSSGRWTEQDQKIIQQAYSPPKISRKDVTRLLEVWAHSTDWGGQILEALQAYYEVFFAEEELRIRPALEAAIRRVQALVARLAVPELLAEISEGIHYAEELQVSEIVLIPSFWITPLITDLRLSKERMLFVFGARPADASLVPGEVVPDALFRALKALADPTRLRIMRYLTAEPLTPAQLSRRLRLRAPTVVHHLRALRVAGLVHLTIESGKKVSYTVRAEAVKGTFTALQSFLAKDGTDA
jgi:DNA-binding transcriptional ArsR family regulator